jgi:signal transduction histidine kinase
MGKKELSEKVFYYSDVVQVDGQQQREIKLYVQVKVTTISYLDQVKKIVQMNDISGTILYHKEQSQNQFLQLINACVSHELRNPLNSIIA